MTDFLAPNRLLAIDDDVSSAELIVRVAERCRYEAFATSDSRGVMNLMNALCPSILAVDICMPNLDANDLFKLLATANCKSTILIVSGQEPAVLEETRQHALALGLNAPCTIQKPIDIAQIRAFLMDHSMKMAS